MKNTNSGGARQNKPMGARETAPKTKMTLIAAKALNSKRKVKMLLITERK